MDNKKWRNGFYVCKKKNFIVYIRYNDRPLRGEEPYWWFSLCNKELGYKYDSECDRLKFKTKEECLTAGVKKIDELTNQ